LLRFRGNHFRRFQINFIIVRRAEKTTALFVFSCLHTPLCMIARKTFNAQGGLSVLVFMHPSKVKIYPMVHVGCIWMKYEVVSNPANG